MNKIKNMLSSNDEPSHNSSSSPRSSYGQDGRANVDTPGSNSAGTNTAPYNTEHTGETTSMPHKWAMGGIGGGNSDNHDSTGTNSGSTGLGNAATGAGSGRNSSGYENEGLTGDRSRNEGLTGDRSRNEGLTGDRYDETSNRQSSGHGFSSGHSIGHDSRDTAKFDPAGSNTTHDHKHLQHVVHRNERHSEVEEVERVRDHQRHVHHLQHHVQPVQDTQVKDEVHHNQIHPVTNIQEKHTNTDEDVRLFNTLGSKHKDTETHMPKERTVVDLGEKVNTTTHHHVHHVTQPVVEQEVHNRHRIHTQIPLTHTVHEAPIIHKSSVHEPVHMQDFLKGGGKLDSGIRHNESGVLSTGECDRQVDGMGEKLAQDLNLKPSTFGQSGTSSTSTTGNTAAR